MSKKRIFFALFTIFVLLILFLTILYYFEDPDRGLVMGDSIGVVEITGVIKDGKEELRQLYDFGKNNKVKAIIIRIDTPGGAVGPSQEIYNEILKIKKKKPVIASIGTIGASGGYYIASGASKIVANPGSITGSIGVIMQFMSFESLLGKVGIKGNVIKSGEYKDTGSPFRDMTKEEKVLMQGLLDDVHNQFIDAVSNGRNLNRKEVEKIADGRIITGKQAKDLKLVDELGNFNDAVEIAKKLSGIQGEPKLIFGRKKKSMLFDLLSDFSENDAKSQFYLLLSDLRIPKYLLPIYKYFEN
ncbi:MAG: signal peptide peptidase SppA [Proteobacteria bacterium]|nr:signal peptide peptidase SppA [Pseudomonadota bacterium]